MVSQCEQTEPARWRVYYGLAFAKGRWSFLRPGLKRMACVEVPLIAQPETSRVAPLDLSSDCTDNPLESLFSAVLDKLLLDSTGAVYAEAMPPRLCFRDF